MAGGTSGLVSDPRTPVLRLLAIPLLVFLGWLLEVFLLAGSSRLMQHPDPLNIAVYTAAGCILTGMIVPLLCIRKAFVTGAVNMFQIGFRTVHRTILACSVTAGAGLVMLLLFNPFGPDRAAFAAAFLLVLPTAAATVMVCWVLAGTHVQAFVRSGGAILSITSGVVVTSLLFASTAIALDPSIRQQGALFWPVCTGIGVALFFFAVRDIYATVIVTAGSSVFLHAALFDPVYLRQFPPELFLASLSAVAVLVLMHLYLSRNFATILVPAAGIPPAGKKPGAPGTGR